MILLLRNLICMFLYLSMFMSLLDDCVSQFCFVCLCIWITLYRSDRSSVIALLFSGILTMLSQLLYEKSVFSDKIHQDNDKGCFFFILFLFISVSVLKTLNFILLNHFVLLFCTFLCNSLNLTFFILTLEPKFIKILKLNDHG